MRKTILTTAGLATLLLASCKDDGDERPPFCQAIGGGAAVATEVCNSNCNQQNIERSVDANFGTYATIGVSVQSEGTLRGTAQDGLVFSGPAGVYVHKPPLVNGGTFNLTITTYLDGVPQESALAYNETSPTTDNTFCNYCGTDGPNNFYGIPTNLPFDAIEMSYSQSAGTQSRAIQLFEFCVLN